MNAVQTAAQSIVVEVRRQFKEIAGIMGTRQTRTTPPACPCVPGRSAGDGGPALLAIIVPILTGLILGAEAVVGLLGGVTVTGFVVAVFMSNAGGAWDNAKSTSRPDTMAGRVGLPQGRRRVRYGGRPSRTPPARP